MTEDKENTVKQEVIEDYTVKQEVTEEIEQKPIEEIPISIEKPILDNKPEIDDDDDDDEEIDFQKKRQLFIEDIKRKKHYIHYGILVIVLWFAYKIRTGNIHLLKDVTTNKLIPIAGDPFIFLRYAKYLLYHGALNSWDTMRFYPYGFDPTENLLGVSYVTVFIYKIVHFFNPSFTIEAAHVYHPPIVFVISLIVFYFLVKRLFNYKIALLSTATLAFIPTFLYRTIAGFSDKEALGFLFYFLILYLYILAWEQKDIKNAIFLGLLSGLATGLMALTWGGAKFLYLIIGGFVLIEILLNKFSEKDFYIYTAWLAMVILIMPIMNSNILSFKGLITSISSNITIIAFGTGLVYYLIVLKNIFRLKEQVQKKVPLGFGSFIIAIALAIIFLLAMYGPLFITQKINTVYIDFLSPFGKTRWQLTVEENQQPYIEEWISILGWVFVLLYLIGSGFLFYEMINPIKKGLKEFNSIYVNQFSLTMFYGVFIFLFTFSRYKKNAVYFNGVTTISKFAYMGSFIIFICIILGGYIYSYYHNKKLYEATKLIDKKYLLLIVWFIVMLIAARSAVRLVMALAPVASIISAYFIFKLINYSLNIKDNLYKYFAITIIALIVVNPLSLGSVLDKGYLTDYYQKASEAIEFIGVSPFNSQWQRAANWTREKTPKDSVFVNWWDYGYWVQTMFERATILDGGNAHGYWNYQIGRHVLTAQNETEALEVMYAHNTTHLLISPGEMEKYSSFSSIGSDINYDRYSWFGAFKLDPRKTVERRDEIVLVFMGGFYLDHNFIYEGQVYPKKKAGIGAVFLPFEEIETTNINNETQKKQKFKQPLAVVMYNNQRTDIPIECLYVNNEKIIFDNPGLKGCFRVFPAFDGNQMNSIGAGSYISKKGTDALWVNLYLLNQISDNLQLVYDDSNQIPLSLYNNKIMGPLKIWKINYPEGFTVSEEKIKLYQGFKHENPEAIII